MPPPPLTLHNQSQTIDACDVDLSGSTFRDAKLHGAAFSNADLSASRFEDVNLSGAQVTNADLRFLQCTNCQTEGMTIDGVAVSALFAAYRGGG